MCEDVDLPDSLIRSILLDDLQQQRVRNKRPCGDLFKLSGT